MLRHNFRFVLVAFASYVHNVHLRRRTHTSRSHKSHSSVAREELPRKRLKLANLFRSSNVQDWQAAAKFDNALASAAWGRRNLRLGRFTNARALLKP